MMTLKELTETIEKLEESHVDVCEGIARNPETYVSPYKQAANILKRLLSDTDDV